MEKDVIKHDSETSEESEEEIDHKQTHPETTPRPTLRKTKKPVVVTESRVRTEPKPVQPAKTVRKVVMPETRKQPVRKVTPRRSGGFGNMSAYNKAAQD